MRGNLAVAYITLVGLPFLVVLGTLEAGRTLVAPAAPALPAIQHAAQSAAAPLSAALVLFLQMAVILLAARVVGIVFRKIGQPQVVGEMAAGILLGPSLLGWVAPGVTQVVFPAASLGSLQTLSQIGLALFMFQVGLELNPKELRGHSHAAVLTSHVSIVVPFCLGTLLAYFLYPRLSNSGVTFSGFALFLGMAMSITAFPVLARILTERKLLSTRMGHMAVACAAVDDVTGWCILAYIVVLVRAHQGAVPLWITVGGAALYIVVMTFGLRRITPSFERSFRRAGRLSDDALALMILLMLGSALVTERLGIHLLFGAFLMGTIMPKSEALVRYIQHRFETLTTVVLLPLFFAFSGLRTSISFRGENGFWVYALLAIAVAVAGKMGGTVVAARVAGVPARETAALGILMNTRGLMELVVLNIGLDLGVISQAVFSIMVVMALATTFMTTPLLVLVYRPHHAAAALAEAQPEEMILEGYS